MQIYVIFYLEKRNKKYLLTSPVKSWREAAVVAQDRCEWKSAGEDVLKALYGESCSAK